mmetsp:Transcript_138132/g.441364  ORF Transcript_138132/g.441364 Transcript_138132/m.441364 type:complete len:292 (-) Transcript_138132:2625-3500(-)
MHRHGVCEGDCTGLGIECRYAIVQGGPTYCERLHRCIGSQLLLRVDDVGSRPLAFALHACEGEVRNSTRTLCIPPKGNSQIVSNLSNYAGATVLLRIEIADTMCNVREERGRVVLEGGRARESVRIKLLSCAHGLDRPAAYCDTAWADGDGIAWIEVLNDGARKKQNAGPQALNPYALNGDLGAQAARQGHRDELIFCSSLALVDVVRVCWACHFVVGAARWVVPIVRARSHTRTDNPQPVCCLEAPSLYTSNADDHVGRQEPSLSTARATDLQQTCKDPMLPIEAVAVCD